MKRQVTFIIAFLALLLGVREASPLEFDQRAKKMGLNGIAWDGTFTVYAFDDELAKETLENIQQSYAKILKQLNQRLLRKKCLVFVWRERQKFIFQAQTFAGSGNISHMGAFVIRNLFGNYHALCTFKSEGLYERVLPHELAHLVLPIFIDPAKEVSIPRWLNEGFSQFQEKDSFKEAVCTVNEAMEKGELFNLLELARLKQYPASFKKNSIFYDQSEVLVRFLIESQNEPGDFFRFVQAVSRPAGGFASALKSYYSKYPDVDSLEKELRDYAARKAREFPAESYRLAYMNLQSARRMDYEGKKEEALREYSRAFSDFVLIRDYFPEYNPAAIRTQLNNCWNSLAEVSGVKESIDLEVGLPREKVIASLGRPQRADREKLSYPGLNIGLDKNGAVSSLEMGAPCTKMVNGIRIGDSLDRVKLLYGIKSPNARAILASLLMEESKLLSMEKIEPGSYPISSEGKFLGQVVKLEGEEDLHFIRPTGSGRSGERITFSGDTVRRLEVFDMKEARPAAGAGPSPRTSTTGEGSKAKKRHDFAIGDNESEFVKYLGEPLDRGDKLMVEQKIEGKKVKKQTFTDKFRTEYLVYEGLYVVLAFDRALCIVAAEPFGGTVHRIAIGDTRERVRQLLGRPDKEGSSSWYYEKMGKRDKYTITFEGKPGKVSQIKVYRSKYRNRTVTF